MEGKIYIIGFIGNQEGDFKGIELVDVITQVRNQPKATSFTCYIDSPGGVVETGETIYKYLKNLKVPVKTVGSNIVASIATVIFMAGDTRVINHGCEFMIHLPMGGIEYATADEMEAHAKRVRLTENRMIKFYSDVTGLEKEAIEPLLKNETWLTGDQLKSFGFITGDSLLKITAKAKFNTNPKNKKMGKDKKGKSFKKKMEAFFDMFDAASGKDTSVILKAADQTDVDFYELEEGTDISVGDKARIDGTDADGDVTMADGRTVTFVAGEVTVIQEAEENTDEEMKKIEEKLEASEAKVSEQATEILALKKEIKTKNKIVANIRKIQSKMTDDGNDGKRTPGGTKSKSRKEVSSASKALANMKKLSNKKQA